MIGCVPETAPVKPGNPDENIIVVKPVEEAIKIVEPDKNTRRPNRAKKN